jgi:uncharacterized protein YbaR (Trm112 family)
LHVLLTDVLTCPRCGPDWPLILLAEDVEDRRVLAGWLGCANCRERFRVEGGFGDVRYGAGGSQPAVTASESAAEAMRIAALLGVTEGSGLVLVVGAGAVNAGAIADLVPGLEVVAAWAPLATRLEREGVSRLGIAGTLPMRSASMRGVALTDASSEALIEEAARVVAPRARVIVFNGGTHIGERLERAGLRVLAQDEHATVAARAAL